MLSDISWQNFLVFIVCVLFVWYAVIGTMYYRADFKSFLAFVTDRNSSGNGVRKNTAAQNDELPDKFEAAQNARDEISNTLLQAAQIKSPKEEIIVALQGCLKNYADLKQTAFQLAINNFISIEIEIRCAILFDEDDMRIIWMN